jgi:thiol-disulfide isomerase/thioredoxin
MKRIANLEIVIMYKLFLLVIVLLLVQSLDAQQIKSIKITDLEKTVAESKTPLIVNFWATYCVPCVEEIPFFQEEVKKQKANGVQLLLVSLDLKSYYPQKIKSFAANRKFTAPILWLNETNADYFCPKVDPKWSGVLPATLFINNSTGYRKFYEEPLSRETLKKEIMAILGK